MCGGHPINTRNGEQKTKTENNNRFSWELQENKNDRWEFPSKNDGIFQENRILAVDIIQNSINDVLMIDIRTEKLRKGDNKEYMI